MTITTTSGPPPPLQPTSPPPKPLDLLDILIVSAKHLKNVNWRNGVLKPFATFWVDPEQHHFTKTDNSGNNRPVWNERFLLPIYNSSLILEIRHLKSIQTASENLLVGTLRLNLTELVDPDDSSRLRTFELFRPSGRPHGKIILKLSVHECGIQRYNIAPPPLLNFPFATSEYRPMPLYFPPRPHPYGGYYYVPQQLPHLQPVFDRHMSSGGPSAPVDYSSYEQKKQKNSRTMSGLVGALGGVTLEKPEEEEEEEMVAERGYGKYHSDYGFY